MDGAKVIVCRLKNTMNYTSIAYPTDELNIPIVQRITLDDDAMELAVLDKKLGNVLGVMGWDLNRAQQCRNT